MIDEADRLLDQSYHGWLGKVLKAAYNKQSTTGFINSDRYIYIAERSRKVSMLDSGSSSPGSTAGRGHCIVF